MICLDVGQKQGSILFLILLFWLVKCLTAPCHLQDGQKGRCIWHWGWGTLVHIEFLNDSNCSTMHKCKGASLQGRHPHITGIWAWCKKIEMICMHLFGGRQSLCQILPKVPHWWGKGIPKVMVQQMLGTPSAPPSRSHLWNANPVSLMLVVRLKKMTHQGLLLWMAGSSSRCDARWPQMWPRGSRSTSHTPGLTCNASSTDDWWSFPQSALPFCTMDSGLPHWNGRVHLDGGYC